MADTGLLSSKISAIWYTNITCEQRFFRSLKLDHHEMRAVVAAISIITTKVVFINGLHYPLRLVLIHLLGYSTLETFRWVSVRMNDRGTSNRFSCECHTNRDSRILALLGNVVRTVCIAGNILCEYQAILHFSTLPALSMLWTLDWTPKIFNGIREKSSSRKIIGTISFFGGMAMVLVFDRKLSPNGLKFAGISILLTAATQAIDYWTMKSCDCLAPPPETSIKEKLGVILVTVVMALAAIRRYEHPIYTPVSLTSLLGVLVINICVTVVAWQSRWSLFRPTTSSAATKDSEMVYDNVRCRLVTSTMLVSLPATGIVLISPFEIASVGQYLGFVISLVATFECDEQSCGEVMEDSNLDHNTLPVVDDPARLSLLNHGEEDLDARQSRRLYKVTLVFCVLLLICPPLYFWTALPSYSQPKAPNSFSPTANHTMDFVVSRYQESADHLAGQLGPLLEVSTKQNRTARIIVYSTGDDDRELFRSKLQHALDFNILVVVEDRFNVGREAGAYLNHISTKWDELADHTLFMQADMHDLWHAQRRLWEYFVPQTGFLSLYNLHESCSSCDRCWDHSTWSERSEVVEDIYQRANSGAACQPFTYTYRGQFVASRQRIHGQGRELFQGLLEDLINPESYMHSPDYTSQPWLPQKEDSLNNPFFGYTLERMWGVIMQCSDVRMKHMCPTLLSSSVSSTLHLGAEDIENCQCLDR